MKWYPQIILSALAGLMQPVNPIKTHPTLPGETNTLALSSIKTRYRHPTKGSHEESKVCRKMAAKSRHINWHK